jgi:hypothetical protein
MMDTCRMEGPKPFYSSFSKNKNKNTGPSGL